MRKLWLSKEDFELFHHEIGPFDFEFFRTHMDAFKRMWREQVGRPGGGACFVRNVTLPTVLLSFSVLDSGESLLTSMKSTCGPTDRSKTFQLQYQ